MNSLRTKGIAYLIIVLLLTSILVYVIYHFQLDSSSLYIYSVIITSILALLFLLFYIQHPEFLKQFKVSINPLKL